MAAAIAAGNSFNGILRLEPSETDGRIEKFIGIIAEVMSRNDPITSWLGAEDHGGDFVETLVRIILATHPCPELYATEDLSGVMLVGTADAALSDPPADLDQKRIAYSHPDRPDHSGTFFEETERAMQQHAQSGKGTGSRLLKALQEDAARRGMGIWLEASSKDSARLYARLGFQHVGELQFVKDMPPLYLMDWQP